jgi:hypothetical protein
MGLFLLAVFVILEVVDYRSRLLVFRGSNQPTNEGMLFKIPQKQIVTIERFSRSSSLKS